jgi:nitrogen regulatory protein PII
VCLQTDDKKVESEGEEKIYATPVMETLKVRCGSHGTALWNGEDI